jgi:glycosyltransferase involved in cell wall biosynthesis
MKKIPVLMFATLFYPLVGGAERQAQRLSKKLIQKGVDVKIVTRRIKGTSGYEILDGIPVIRLFCFDSIPKVNEIFLILQFLIYALRHRNEHEIIHVPKASLHTLGAVIIARLLKKRSIAKIGSGGELFDIRAIEQISVIGGFTARYILNNIDRLISVSSTTKADLLSYGFSHNKIVDIPNGVIIPNKADKSKKMAIKARLDLPDKLILLFVGNFHPVKNVPCLIEAFSMVNRNRSDMLLVLLGDGPERAVIERLIQDGGLQNSVILTGRVDNVDEYLMAGDIFVLPSITEGLSNALLEAMSYGLPCVATKVSGNIDIIDHGENGFLVEVNDAQELANAITILAWDRELRERLGKEGRSTIEARYSMDKVANSYKKLYRELLDNKEISSP